MKKIVTKNIYAFARDFLQDEEGATAIEYALIVSATALAIAPIMPVLKAAFIAEYTTIANTLK